jgi:hypothetical protein
VELSVEFFISIIPDNEIVYLLLLFNDNLLLNTLISRKGFIVDYFIDILAYDSETVGVDGIMVLRFHNIGKQSYIISVG